MIFGSALASKETMVVSRRIKKTEIMLDKRVSSVYVQVEGRNGEKRRRWRKLPSFHSLVRDEGINIFAQSL